MLFFFFKQKTAYEMRISDWSSDVCSSDLARLARAAALHQVAQQAQHAARSRPAVIAASRGAHAPALCRIASGRAAPLGRIQAVGGVQAAPGKLGVLPGDQHRNLDLGGRAYLAVEAAPGQRGKRYGVGEGQRGAVLLM